MSEDKEGDDPRSGEPMGGWQPQAILRTQSSARLIGVVFALFG
jgi:hypothetical protein